MPKIRPALFLLLLVSLPVAALDNARPDVRKFIDEVSREQGFDRAQLSALLKQAETKQAILDAISRPAERVTPWHEYRERFLTEKRILEGAGFWSANAQRLDSIDDPGVAAATVGILGVETSFGRITGRYRVIDALATLAFDYPPRGEFFRGELKQFLLLAREETIDPKDALGSYAGAMGAPQFISSSYRKFAVDADGDGHRDLWTNWADVIGSVANYLRVHGWRKGEQVVARAMPGNNDLSAFDMTTIQLNETVASLRQKGVSFETDLPPESPAMFFVLDGKTGPEYWVGFTNFFVITRYNRSNMYAMAVHDLGQAIRGFMQDTER